MATLRMQTQAKVFLNDREVCEWTQGEYIYVRPPSKCQELREKNAGHVAAEHRLLQPQTALAVTQQVGRPGASFANSKVDCGSLPCSEAGTAASAVIRSHRPMPAF